MISAGPDDDALPACAAHGARVDEPHHIDSAPDFPSAAPRRQLADAFGAGQQGPAAHDVSLSQPRRCSQPCPNLLRGLGTRKAVQKQRCPQPYPVVPTFCYTFMWENGKRREHVFLYEKRRTPRWGHRGWDHNRSNYCKETIKGCPNPLEGWDHAFGGWDRDGQRVDLRRPRRPWSFSL